MDAHTFEKFIWSSKKCCKILYPVFYIFMVEKYENMLKAEVNLLKNVIKRHKKQFRAHKVMNTMHMLHTKLNKTEILKFKENILQICENIYVFCSKEVVNGFFLQFNMLTMGIVARIHCIVRKMKKQHPNGV